MKNTSVDKFELSTSDSEKIKIDNSTYTVFVEQKTSLNPNAPRLVVVSYLPTSETITLLKLCIDTILKYTDSPYELWVVDNNSPVENIRWLTEYNTINLAFNRTEPGRAGGSYANAIGLEIGRRVIDVKTKYMMTLHQDTVVCCTGWLMYLLSKLNETVKAAGVREDISRVKSGILHVLGYLVDFQLFQNINLNFLPDLPKYDVGDRAIVDIKNAGYEIFSTPNTLWDAGLIEKLPLYPPFKGLDVDRSIGDDNHVLFMHLGRGVRKSIYTSEDSEQTKSIEVWSSFVAKYLLEEDVVATGISNDYIARIEKVPSYSLRRYLVDCFFEQSSSFFPAGVNILDIGGKKESKRGFFNIEEYDLEVDYVNIDATTCPDYCCAADNIPLPDASYDWIIFAEVLEHLLDPQKALAESFRLLRPGGRILLTVPFTFHIHGDPDDYARYTSSWFRTVMKEIGFQYIYIEKQGLFFLVLANMFGCWLQQKTFSGFYSKKIKRYFFNMLLGVYRRQAFSWDKSSKDKGTVLTGYTTGYGIVAQKSVGNAE